MPLYVYALAGSSAPGVVAAGHQIEWVDVDGVQAAVELLDAAPALSEAVLREQHDVVIAIAAAVEAVLPARFGSLCEEEELRRVVVARRREIGDALALVRGREQMTVRFPERAGVESPPPVVPARASGAEYLRARRDAAARGLPPALDVLRHALGPLVASERVQPAEGKRPAAVYHLIERGTAPAYRDALARIAPRVDGAMSVSGPWPPFAFAPEWLP